MQSSPIQFDFKELAATLSDQEFAQHLHEYGIGLTKQEACYLQDMFSRELSLNESIIFSVYFKHIRTNDELHKLLKNLPTEGRHVFQRSDLDSNLIEITEINGEKYLLSLEQTNQLIYTQNIQKQDLIHLTQELDTKALNKTLSFGADPIAAVKVLSASPEKDPAYRYKFRTAQKYSAKYLSSLGIPYLNGKLQFSSDLHHDFIQNTLHIGLVRESNLVPQVLDPEYKDKAYKVIFLGRPNDLSGFENSPFLDKLDLEPITQAFPDDFYDKHLFLAIQDLFQKLKEEDLLSKIALRTLDTGGLVTGLLKMLLPSGRGAQIQTEDLLSRVPNEAIKLCASTAGRFVLLVPSKLAARVVKHFNKDWSFKDYFPESQALVIGELQDTNTINLVKNEASICTLPLSEFKYEESIIPEEDMEEKRVEEETLDLSEEEILELILKMVKRKDFMSHRPILNTYDKTVQGLSILEADKSELGMILPLRNCLELEDRSEKKIGICLGLGSNFQYARRSPYTQASLSVLSAMRQVAATGATPWCISDALNFKHYNVGHLHNLQSEAVEGIGEALRVIGHKINLNQALPCISGSTLSHNPESALFTDLNVQYSNTIISILGRINDYTKAINSQIKNEKSLLYLIGPRKANLGGSLVLQLLKKDISFGHLPSFEYDKARQEIFGLVEAIDQELVLAAHSISEGGMIAALLNMFLVSEAEMGAEIEFPTDSIGLSFAEKLFAENGGFICQVAEKKSVEFETLLRDFEVSANIIGRVKAKSEELTINNLRLNLAELRNSFYEQLNQKI